MNTWKVSLPILAAALLAGCGSGPVTPVAESTTPLSTTVPVTSAPVTVTVTGPPSSTSAEPEDSTPKPCADTDLVVYNQPLESQGSEYRLLVLFENTTSKACTLQGYPGVDIVNETGPAVHVERRMQNAAPLLTLQPGEIATADLQSSDTHPETDGACPRWGQVIVIAPNTFQQRPLDIGMPLCKALVSSVT